MRKNRHSYSDVMVDKENFYKREVRFRIEKRSLKKVVVDEKESRTTVLLATALHTNKFLIGANL